MRFETSWFNQLPATYADVSYSCGARQGCRVLAYLRGYIDEIPLLAIFLSMQGTVSSQKSSWGTRWRSWLRQYATRRKIVGSITDEVIRLFSSLNLPTALLLQSCSSLSL